MTSKHENLTINYKFSQPVLDSLLFSAEMDYEHRTVGSRDFHHETGKPYYVTEGARVLVYHDNIAQGMEEFHQKRLEGYTLANIPDFTAGGFDGFSVIRPSIRFEMRKPDALIAEELKPIFARIEAEYRAELEAKHAAFIEALAEREIAREDQKEIDRLAAIEAEKVVVRGQRVAALKAELAKTHTIEDAPKPTKGKAK